MSTEPLAYSREMAVTHRDFFRTLPRAMGEHAYSVDNNKVTAQLHDGSLSIEIGPEQVRRIALLAIDYCVVKFRFENLSEEQITEFQNRFELYYRRGGG